MTFADALARITVAVDRPDIAAQYLTFLNRAVREAAVRNNWEQMKSRTEIVLAAGQRERALPADFKAWQNGRNAVEMYRTGTDDEPTPVPVYTRGEMERLISVFKPEIHAIFTQDNGAFQVKFPAAMPDNMSLILHYFAFPAEVTDTTQSTPLLLAYPNMVISKALSLIFQSINDPVYQLHEQQFTNEVLIAKGVNIRNVLPQPDPEKE